MAPAGKRVAVIDIGTNSTRLLIADVEGSRVDEVIRRSKVTRLGRGVDLSGALSSEAIEDVCRAIAAYSDECREAQVDSMVALATSAVRDAGNGDAFLAELRERFGLDARLIDGEEEARLTYRGAVSGDPPTESTLVIDIGGGSTEVVIGRKDSVEFFSSLQAGVVRHTERHLISDPPITSQLEALASDIRNLLDVALTGNERVTAKHAIGVAGTPTSLAAIDLELDPYDPKRVHGHHLDLTDIQRLVGRLAGLPTAERAELTGLHPDRAPTIVAGVVILIEVMRAFGVDRIAVSEHDILYGAAIETAGMSPQG